jgi:cell division protein FtsB
MFFWNNDRKKLVEAINYLDDQVEALRQRVNKLEDAPYGFNKDGSRRKRIGRPIKNKREDWE